VRASAQVIGRKAKAGASAQIMFGAGQMPACVRVLRKQLELLVWGCKGSQEVLGVAPWCVCNVCATGICLHLHAECVRVCICMHARAYKTPGVIPTNCI
jgi:hypothetical protein